ncbi:MAG: hypothetical protein IPN70_03130 [Candidatus Moraniibacteriota bacterium]|nr:MAG: hypothetical protein IPN70_03130 [Candidatus Moranbacteria bacterium]
MKALRRIQNILLAISLFILMYLPLYSAFGDDNFVVKGNLFMISFFSVFLVMLIRPLADIFSSQKWLRNLVLLRKGFGVLSASIVVGFMLGNIIDPSSNYLAKIFSASYWSLENYAFFAHIGDITGLILLLTSNNLSIIFLKGNWKRIQRLSYVYFYAGGIYEAFAFESAFAGYAMVVVTSVTLLAFFIKLLRKRFGW